MEAVRKDLDMARQLAEKVARQGGSVYFVGGCVRDGLLGRETTDLDVEVHGVSPARLEEILDSLGSRMALGESFGIYRLRGYSLDIAMPRKEALRGTGHRDFDVFVDPFIGPEKAALRRDFTVNAMMRHVLTGALLDPFGGEEDLRRGILRHVSPETFPEDPLRVLRGAQFAARFGLTPAPETVELCRGMSLGALPRERILGELEKALLLAPRPSVFFEVLEQMEQLDLWFPEVKALRGVPQNPKYHAEGDVWVHTMLVLDQAAALRGRTQAPLELMLSALTHDFGKAICTRETDGVIHSYDHEQLGQPLIEAFLRRLTGNRRCIELVLNLTRSHMRPNTAAAAGASIKSTNRMFDESLDPEGLICLALADNLGKIAPGISTSHGDFLYERLAIYREYMARPHVTGKDLIAAGLQPDARFSRILEYAHKLRLAGIPREEALKQTLGHARRLKDK